MDWVGSARLYGLNGHRRADGFMNGGFEGGNYVGKLLANGSKQLVVTALDGKITDYDIMPA